MSSPYLNLVMQLKSLLHRGKIFRSGQKLDLIYIEVRFVGLMRENLIWILKFCLIRWEELNVNLVV